jgi:hypothetical protein
VEGSTLLSFALWYMQVVVVRREAEVGSNGLSDVLFMAQNEGKSWDRAGMA